MTAYYKEFNTILSLLNVHGNETEAGRLFVRGDIDGLPVVLTATGEGMINSALTAQLMLSKYRPSHLLFAGVGAGLAGAARRGSVVIPRAWANAGHQRLAATLRTSTGAESSDFFVESFDVNHPDKFVPAAGSSGSGAAFQAASLGAPFVGEAPQPDADAVRAVTERGGQVVPGFGIPMFSEVLSAPDGSDAFANEVPQTLW